MSARDVLTKNILRAIETKGYKEAEAEFGEGAVRRALANKTEVIGPGSLSTTKSPVEGPEQDPEIWGLKPRDIDEDFGVFPADVSQGQIAPPTRGKLNKPLAAAVAAGAALTPEKASGSPQNPVSSMRGIGPVANPDLYGAAIEKKQPSEPSAEAGVEAGDIIKIRDADRKRLDSRLQAYDNAVANLRKAGVDTSGFDAEAKELKAAYKEAKTRNEWLEVAQLVGQALARFGAYAQGARDGKLIAPGMDIPSVDYSKRTGQEFEDYRTSLQDVATRRREASDAEREAYNSELRKLALQDLGVKTEQNIYDQQMASNRAEAQLQAGLRADARKDAAVSARESSALFNQASNIADDAARDEKAVAAQISNTQAALETYLSSSDKKQKEKAAAALAAAGVDTARVDAALDESGRGLFKLENPQQAKEALLSGGLLEPLRVQLEEIRKRKARAEYIMNKHMGAGTGTEKPQTAAPQKKTVTKEKLQAYMKQYNLTEQAARNALTSQGLEVE